MHLSTIFTLVTGFIATTAYAAAIPTASNGVVTARSTQCENPLVRKEWRYLTDAQQKKWHESVLCMMHSPAKLSQYAEGVTTRWEDFVWTHQRVTPKIHLVAHFLPWHRLFLAKFEEAMINECGWTGGMPYWDESLDWKDIMSAPIFSGPNSFGGNGVYDPEADIFWIEGFPKFVGLGGGCVPDGPYANEVIHLKGGSDPGYTERCIKRNIIQEIATIWVNPNRELDALNKPTFYEFSQAAEGDLSWASNFGLHNGGHMLVEGDMKDTYTSPSDPTFYVFHANVDRIWARWQERVDNHLFEINGPIAPRIKLESQAWPDAPDGDVTLDFVLNLGPIDDQDVTVAQLMDTLGSMPEGYSGTGANCYKYDYRGAIF